MTWVPALSASRYCRRLLSLACGVILFGASLLTASAQHAELRRVPQRLMPQSVDSNSPAFWVDGKLSVFNSTGESPFISEGTGPLGPWWSSERIQGTLLDRKPAWIESVWMDPDGVLFAWYHHEPQGLCGDKSTLTAPKIGAAVSFDGGRTLQDLGIVLESGEELNCAALNGYFAGGHGDFSVIPDAEHRFLYFVFSNYAGPSDEQGIAIARMAYEDRFGPVGAVWKFRQGEWLEPGLGGRVSAVYRARTTWAHEESDAFWGPSVHWNTYLEKYVILLNHSCCSTGWPQEGIYISYARDIGDPTAWSEPVKLLDGEKIGFRAGFYPQVLGLGEGETDSTCGWLGRLYIQGISRWEVIFVR